MMKAKVGDKVKVRGNEYEIAKLYYSCYYGSERFPSPDDGWMIEFVDTNGFYHYWKQMLDGGEFIPS